MNIWLDDVIIPVPEESYIVDPITDWIWIRNLDELRELLNEAPDGVRIEVMSFDYNLGIYEKKGDEVVRWLSLEHPDKYPVVIKAHTGSLEGEQKIWEADRRARKMLKHLPSE